MTTANIRLLCFLGLILHFIPSIAQTPDFKKLSGLVRQAALESVAFTRGTSSNRSITAFVKTDSRQPDIQAISHYQPQDVTIVPTSGGLRGSSLVRQY